MTVEQFERLLELVGGATTIGIGALAAFVLFKLVIYLSTTGAIVYCIKLVVTSIQGHFRDKQGVQAKAQEAQIEMAKNPPPVADVMIKDMVINNDAYESLCSVLARVRSHTNRNRETMMGGFLGGHRHWIHTTDVQWLRAVIECAIEEELESDQKAEIKQ